MSLFELSPNPGSTKKKTRIGRGTGNGTGQSCGRGDKGQKSRSGGSLPAYFEGGQMPLYRRIPKRGFKPMNKLVYNIINVATLNTFKDGATINEESLLSKGLIKDNGAPVKLLANGKLEVKDLKIKVNAASAAALELLKKSGCTIELI